MSSPLTTICTLPLVACGVGLFLHGFGIFAIVSHAKKSNQTILVFSLSSSEISIIINILCTILITKFELLHLQGIWERASSTILYIVRNFTLLELFLVMIILTVDRLGSAINPIRYKIWMSRSRMKKVIFVSWIASLICGILTLVVRDILHAMQYILTGIGSLYIILVIATYSFIIYKVNQSREQFRLPTSRQSHEGMKFKKEYLIPTLIIISFIVLYYLPLVIITILQSRGYLRTITIDLYNLLICLGLIFDPMIYVFLTKHYRDIIVRRFCTCRQQIPPAAVIYHISLPEVVNNAESSA